ncbi:MAG: hypothetical protein ABSC23_14805 [Bryobacteraceae bacterium]|jgi:hypothetical protein
MTHISLSSAIACSLALAGFAASLITLWTAQRLTRGVDQRAEARRSQWEAALAVLRQETEACAKQLRRIEEHPSVPAGAGLLKPGFNLSKRSQALRMHRRGDAPEQIASALEVSIQEVNLLLKVHRIVIGSV